jgi:ribosome biogenesis GTPase
VVAANVNVTFIVMALDQDYSLRRLERYLLLARESGAAPVVLLTKPDVGDDVPARVADVQRIAAEAPVHVLNPKAGEGVEHVLHYLTRGRTGALLGSSGVGKTTLINRLLGSGRGAPATSALPTRRAATPPRTASSSCFPMAAS